MIHSPLTPSASEIVQPSVNSAGAETSRLAFIDGLRGIASFIVVFGHFVGFWNATRTHFISSHIIAISDYGRHGVDIFFVLSGFVIALTLRHKYVDIRTFAKFIMRRSVRIDIPYWGAIGAMYLFWLLQWKFGKPPAFPTLVQLAAHFVYMQDLLGFEQINIIFWTLCIEIQFYLIFCFLLGAIQAASRPVVRSILTCLIFGALFPLSIFASLFKAHFDVPDFFCSIGTNSRWGCSPVG